MMLPSGTDKTADSAISYATRRRAVVSFTLDTPTAYSRSITVTFAVPPPSHIVCSP